MHNSRQNLLKTILGNNNMNKNKPVLTLNMNDKMYLAVAKNFTDVLSFVYTLACNKAANSDKYDMVEHLRFIHSGTRHLHACIMILWHNWSKRTKPMLNTKYCLI